MVVRPLEISLAAGAVDDLQEDLRSAWTPDVAAWADLEILASWGDASTASFVAQRLRVPRPDGRHGEVRVLHPAWHLAMHRASATLRASIDARLDPGVFGYRAGAVAGRRYADDWRRFCSAVAEHADRHRFVVLTDVRSFFGSTSWSRVLSSLEHSATEAQLASLRHVAAAMSRSGVEHLPTGYADARMLANVVLSAADAEVDRPFCRWVDDYRIFVDDSSQAEVAIASLDRALQALGLSRSLTKTRTIRAEEAVETQHRTLASVYHPERDSAEIVRSRLRDVLAQAMADPIGKRRELRFALPRLAEQGDDVAVPFALAGLSTLPWDAPRLVAYLAEFADTHDLAPAVNATLVTAVERGDAWSIGRLAPLAARVGLSPESVRALEGRHDELIGTPSWGLVLRLLAMHGRVSVVRRALTGPTPDGRAALAAAAEVGVKVPRWLRRAEPVLASVLADAPAPALPTATLL